MFETNVISHVADIDFKSFSNILSQTEKIYFLVKYFYPNPKILFNFIIYNNNNNFYN